MTSTEMNRLARQVRSFYAAHADDLTPAERRTMDDAWRVLNEHATLRRQDEKLGRA